MTEFFSRVHGLILYRVENVFKNIMESDKLDADIKN